MNPKVKLFITGCSDGLLWYSDKVGQTVPYLYSRKDSERPPEHISQESTGLKNFVRDRDCKFVYFHHRPFEGK